MKTCLCHSHLNDKGIECPLCERDISGGEMYWKERALKAESDIERLGKGIKEETK